MKWIPRARVLWSRPLCVVAGLLLAASVAGIGGAHAATHPGLRMPSASGQVTHGGAPSASSTTPCVFLSQDTCTSVDQSVTVEASSNGDTSACTFGGTIDWGDGSAPQNIPVFAGGPDGSVFDLGDYKYTAPGTFTITVTGEVLSGSCAFGTGTVQFTLSSLITSPTADSVLAMTDTVYLSPQPTDAERVPTKRKLTVTGIDNCGCAITVNGVAADVTGTTWTAKIPISSVGPLTISVDTAAGEHDSADITLIDLRVVNPAENATLPLTTDPAMPQLNATLEVAGLPATLSASGVVFNWTLEMINRYVVPRNSWQDDVQKVATGSTTGTAATWQLPADTPVVGGWGRLTVKAVIPGVADPTVTSEPRWVNIPGANPGEGTVASYLAANAGDNADALTHIACHETGGTFDQFRETAQPLTIRYRGTNIPIDAKSDKIPDGWPNPAPLRPIFGYPSGIGIMQLDPATFPDQQWDWQTNVLGGISLYAEKQRIATRWPAHEQKAIDATGQSDLRIVNAARAAKHLTPVSLPKITVKSYDSVQLTDDTIRGYNGYGSGGKYHQFTFDRHYVMSANHLELTVAGEKEWVKTVIPAAFNPDYVDKVLACG